MRIEELISKEALAQFDTLEMKLDTTVASFDKLLVKTVELNKQLAGAQGFASITKSAKELEASEAALTAQQKKMQEEMDRLQKKYEQASTKLVEVAEKERQRAEAQKAGAKASEEAAQAAQSTTTALNSQQKAFEALLKQSVANDRASKSLKAEQKALTAEFNAGLISQDAYEAGLVSIKNTELQLKVANGELNKALKNLTVENEAARGSIQQMDAQLKLMLQSYDRASDEFKASPLGATLLADIENLTAAISKEEEATGRFQRSVGNYSSATKVLEKALADVNKKLDAYTVEGKQADAVVESLRKEQELLSTLLKSNVTGFATATAEVRANTDALQKMAAAGLEGTTAYAELKATTADLKDETADLKAALKNAAPDDVAFNAAADAARGLVGVYGLAKSVSAAFGIENEALQETMVKLQAAETALQSIEAIRAVFKKENAVRQAIEIGRGKVLLVQKYLETAAENRNTVAKYAAITAQKIINAVMRANPLLLLIGLIAAATAAWIAFSSATEKSALNFDKLNAEIDFATDKLDDYVSFIKRNGDEELAALEAQFTDEAALRRKRTDNLKEELRSVIEVENERKEAAEASRKFLERIAKSGRTEFKGKEGEEVEKAQEFLKKQEALANRRKELSSQVRITLSNNSKATTEELIKDQQTQIEIQKTYLQTQITVQGALVANTKLSYEERIKAAQEFSRLQQAVINADATKSKLTPGQTPQQIRLIEAQRSAAIIQARTEAAKQIEDLQNEFLERERKARFEITKLQLEDTIRTQEVVISAEATGFDRRLSALNRSFEARRAILIGEYQEAVRVTTLTAQERLAIEAKYASDVQALTAEYGVRQIDVYQLGQEKFNAVLERDQQKRLDKITTNQNKEITALNTALQGGNVRVEEYASKRADIERKYAQQSLQAEIDVVFGKVILTKEGTAARAAAEAELSEKVKAYSDSVLEKERENQQKMADLRQQIGQAAFDFTTTLFDAQFEKEKNAIQEQIDLLEVRKQKDIEVANQTIASEQEKAAAITVINARAAAERERLERRQRQIQVEQARFNKAASVAQIIASTAQATVAALGSIPYTSANIGLAAATAALGAIQLARALATPIPTYDEGTMDHPGGLAKVHANEMVVTPDGRLTYTGAVHEQVMNLPKHTVVIPDARKALENNLTQVRSTPSIAQLAPDRYRELAEEMRKTRKAILGKKETTFIGSYKAAMALYKHAENQWRYIDDNINF
jgi:hypothetical protein